MATFMIKPRTRRCRGMKCHYDASSIYNSPAIHPNTASHAGAKASPQAVPRARSVSSCYDGKSLCEGARYAGESLFINICPRTARSLATPFCTVAGTMLMSTLAQDSLEVLAAAVVILLRHNARVCFSARHRGSRWNTHNIERQCLR